MVPVSTTEDFWVFGYGSLIWRPDFPVLEVRSGRVHGWRRAFVQGSPDHRGTPEAPGRVLTLSQDAEASVFGRAYRVPGHVLVHLDHREKAGYEHHRVSVVSRDGRPLVAEALLYVAGPDNPCWLGPTDLADAARHVLSSKGPSGTNLEYVQELARALTDEGIDDPDVHDLATAVSAPAPGPLAVTTCSAAKDPSIAPIPALVRYRCPRIDHVLNRVARDRRPLAIFSGRFGLLGVGDPIPPYDYILPPGGVTEAADAIARRLRAWQVTRVEAHLRDQSTPGWAPYHEALRRGAAAASVRYESVPIPDDVLEAPAR